MGRNDVWFLRYRTQQTEVDPENQNFEKMKKTSEDIIILQMCTINDNHIM